MILIGSKSFSHYAAIKNYFRKNRKGLIMVGLNFTFATAEVMMNFNIIASMLNLCDDIDRIKARQKLEYLSRLNPVFYVMV